MILQMAIYCQAGHYCSLQSSWLSKTTDIFSPIAACIATSSIAKYSQYEYQLNSSMFCDQNE